MGSVKSVRAMATQRQGTGSFYTATYYLKYLLDNKVWNIYKENNEKKVNLRKNGLLKRANCFAAHFPSHVQTCLAANQVVANLVPRAGRREPWERGWLLQVA